MISEVHVLHVRYITLQLVYVLFRKCINAKVLKHAYLITVLGYLSHSGDLLLCVGFCRRP